VLSLVVGGDDTCKVGLVAKEYEPNAKYLDGKYVKVTELYTNHDDDTNRRLLHYHKYGCAMAVVVSGANGVE
jgi:hypothetical protein